MVVADARQPEYPIVLANQAFLDLTGYAADEIVGRNCRFLQGTGTSPAAVAEVRYALTAGKGVDVELLNYKKDGSSFWNQLHVSPILDDDGEVAYFFASQIYVTKYRKVQALEASEHRLLMEVDHRAKNVLAIVDSIVRLSNADNPAAYASAVQERVQSLARAHALLSENSWKAIDIRNVIEAQISRYPGSHITMSGPGYLVVPEAVQPLSLVIHELAVNAVTHEAPVTARSRTSRDSVGAKPGGRSPHLDMDRKWGCSQAAGANQRLRNHYRWSAHRKTTPRLHYPRLARRQPGVHARNTAQLGIDHGYRLIKRAAEAFFSIKTVI
ncbi:PAS domain-containing protein [Rhizobium sp. SG741]|uniref:PAS domain-containing protein n=1 Tax=Rhizobium sp. SG741 TaxID=2587114 RepID=UPI001833325E|nr:PAS domain S-box-containing protein [Rhizobium sp. SG741]